MAELTQDMDTAAESPGIWERIKNGAWAAITAIPRAIAWTGVLFVASSLLGKWTKNEKFDFLGINEAVKDKEPGEASVALLKKALVPMAISTGFSGLVGTVTTTASCPNPPACTPQPNLPRIAENQYTGRTN